MRLALSVLAAIGGSATLADRVAAQGVPYGQAVVSADGTTATTNSLFLADRAGSCNNINGLATGEIGAVELDPIDKRIWIGGASGQRGVLLYVTIDAGLNVVTETLHATLPSILQPRNINGIAFDDDGNPVCAAQKEVYVVGRRSAAVTVYPVPGVAGSGSVTAICRDPQGNLFVGVNDTGRIFMLQKNPDCTYRAPQQLGVITPASTSALITGLEYLQGTPPQLYWTSRGTLGTSTGRFPLPAGPPVAGGTTPDEMEAIDYDVRLDDFLVVQRSGFVMSMTKGFATSTVCSVTTTQMGLTGVDTSDSRDGDTNIAPMCVHNQLFTLDIGTSAPSGRPVGIFIISPAVVTLTTATADATGRVHFSVPNLWMASGTPGVVTFASAYLNASNRLVIGPIKRWPAN